MAFDGISGYIDCGLGEELRPNKSLVTMSAWVRPYKLVDKAAICGNRVLDQDGYYIGTSWEGFAFALPDHSWGSQRYTYYILGKEEVSFKWYHVVGVQRSGTRYLYVDGEEVSFWPLSEISSYGDIQFQIGRASTDKTGDTSIYAISSL